MLPLVVWRAYSKWNQRGPRKRVAFLLVCRRLGRFLPVGTKRYLVDYRYSYICLHLLRNLQTLCDQCLLCSRHSLRGVARFRDRFHISARL